MSIPPHNRFPDAMHANDTPDLPVSDQGARNASLSPMLSDGRAAFTASGGTRVVEVASENEWRALKDEWNDLLARSDSNILFLTHEWLTSWWAHIGRPLAERGRAALFVIMIRRNGALCAAAPFTIEVEYVLGLRTRIVRFLGHGASDYLDLIVAEDREPLLALIVGCLAAQTAAWDIVELREFSAQSVNRVPFGRLMARAGLTMTSDSDSICSSIQVSGDWAGFLQMRFNGQRRKKFRAEWRHWIEAAPVDVRFVNDLELATGLPDRLADIERDHPAAVSGAREGTFRDPWLGSFLRHFLPVAAERGWLDIALIEHDGQDAAYQLWFRYHGSLYGYAMAYRAKYAKHGPGKLLLLRALEHHWQRGISEFELLRGGIEYKQQFATATRQNFRLVASHNLARSRLRTWLRLAIVPRLVRRVPVLVDALAIAANEGLGALLRRALVRLRRQWNRQSI